MQNIGTTPRSNATTEMTQFEALYAYAQPFTVIPIFLTLEL